MGKTMTDIRPYHLDHLRRAAAERRKAAQALTEGARRVHLDLAEIFEARAGILPAAATAADSSNVIQLRPNNAPGLTARAAAAVVASETSTKAEKPRRRAARTRTKRAATPRAG